MTANPAPARPLGSAAADPQNGDQIAGSSPASTGSALMQGGTSWMLAGSLIAAGGAYLFQMFVAHEVGSRAYASISVLWTIQYLLLSVVLYSVEAWAIRAVATGGGALDGLRAARKSLAWTTIGLGAVLTLVAWLARDRFFGGRGDFAGVVCLTLATYVLFVVARAVLAGRNRFKAYGMVTALESVIRLVLVVAIVGLGGGQEAIAWSMPFGALGAAAYWFVARRTRQHELADDGAETEVAVVPDGRTEKPMAFLLATVPANACGQILLAGGPLVLAAMGAQPETTSTFFVAVTVARIPLVIAQGGLLSRLLPIFTGMARAGQSRLLSALCLASAAVTVALALVVGGVAALAGPVVLGLLYGEEYRPSVGLAAGAAGAVMLSAGCLLLNQVLVACRREKALALPWGLALAAAGITVAVVPGHPEGRVLAGMVVGLGAALIGLLLASLNQARQLVPQI